MGILSFRERLLGGDHIGTHETIVALGQQFYQQGRLAPAREERAKEGLAKQPCQDLVIDITLRAEGERPVVAVDTVLSVKRSPKASSLKTDKDEQSSNDDKAFHDAESSLPSTQGRCTSV